MLAVWVGWFIGDVREFLIKNCKGLKLFRTFEVVLNFFGIHTLR